MAISTSIFLIALGAILTFAVQYDIAGVDINVVGVILMIAGAIGALLTLTVWGPRRRAGTDVTRETVRETDREPY